MIDFPFDSADEMEMTAENLYLAEEFDASRHDPVYPELPFREKERLRKTVIRDAAKRAQYHPCHVCMEPAGAEPIVPGIPGFAHRGCYADVVS